MPGTAVLVVLTLGLAVLLLFGLRVVYLLPALGPN